jgi:hypothetical protein
MIFRSDKLAVQIRPCFGGIAPAFMVTPKNLDTKPVKLSVLMGWTEILLDEKWWHWRPRIAPDYLLEPKKSISWRVSLDDKFIKLADGMSGFDHGLLRPVDDSYNSPKISSGNHLISFRVCMASSDALEFCYEND